jgi:hypothetical protein
LLRELGANALLPAVWGTWCPLHSPLEGIKLQALDLSGNAPSGKGSEPIAPSRLQHPNRAAWHTQAGWWLHAAWCTHSFPFCHSGRTMRLPSPSLRCGHRWLPGPSPAPWGGQKSCRHMTGSSNPEDLRGSPRGVVLQPLPWAYTQHRPWSHF